MSLFFIFFIRYIAVLGADNFKVDFEDNIRFTDNNYVYLAEPVYIYKIDKTLSVKNDTLDNSLDSQLTRMVADMASEDEIFYVFEVIEVLTGKKRKHITLSFFSINNKNEKCELSNDFNGHSDSEFWETSLGRSIMVNTPETHLLHSCFVIGEQYLLIGSRDFKQKSYELIKSSDDLWLKYIKKVIQKNNKNVDVSTD